MKKMKLSLAFGLLLTTQFSQAQTKEENSDSTKIKLGKDTELIIIDHSKKNKEEKQNEDKTIEKDKNKSESKPKKYENSWSGIDVGYNMLLNSSNQLSFGNTPYWENEVGRSSSFHFNAFSHKFPIMKQYVGFVTGFGFGMNSIGINRDYRLQTNSDSTYAILINDSTNNVRQNSLTMGIIEVPLLIEFATKSNREKAFYLSTGVIGGIRVGSSYNMRGKKNNVKYRETVNDDFNINPFQLDATVRIGYGGFGAYASYGLTNLFKANKSPQMSIFQFGVTIHL
jgi:hypothetical protein